MRARTSSMLALAIAAVGALHGATASAVDLPNSLASALPARPAPVATPAPRAVPMSCNRVLPLAGRAQGFQHLGNRLTVGSQGAQHRGYDAFVRAGQPQVLTATFAYDTRDARLQDEDVDVYALRDCARWELLGTTRTSRHGQTVATADGGSDHEGGRVAFRVPDARRLGPGLHRVRFVVRGDRTTADAYLNVVPTDGSRFVVTDVDGTLTESEDANLRAMAGLAQIPAAHPGAAAALRSLAQQGYAVFYLTGRSDMYQQDTRSWLETHGFPPGVLRTRTGTRLFGIGGPDTTQYKTRELAAASQLMGRAAAWAFGNTMIDVAAYDANHVSPSHRFFYRFEGERRGGQRLEDYRSLAPSIEADRHANTAQIDATVTGSTTGA